MTDADILKYLLIFVLFFVLIFLYGKNKRGQLKRYIRITRGMSEKEMLRIMGGGYNKSLLSGSKVKYEWRINASSYGSHGYRFYSGVSKVDIVTRNGIVIEVRPYNV